MYCIKTYIKMMKIFCIIISLLLLSACGGETTGRDVLMQQLRESVRDGSIMFGHQDDLMYGHGWIHSDQTADFSRSDVKESCGAFPAVYGMDLGGIETGSVTNLDGNTFDNMRASAIAHYKRGGVVTFSWHPRNPLTDGDAWDVSSANVVESVLPGGSRHDLFMEWLANAADFMESIQAGGRPVPLIFRPWHEHTGSWFWWGRDLCTIDQYKALWKLTYDYMVSERGLDHLVWAYSPGAGGLTDELFAERYPGDDMVDIIGFDCYQYASDEAYAYEMKQALDIIARFGKEHDKILAVTETGFESVKNPKWWTQVLYPSIQGYPVSYVLVWRNACDIDTHFYAPFKGHESAEDFKAFSGYDKIKFL